MLSTLPDHLIGVTLGKVAEHISFLGPVIPDATPDLVGEHFPGILQALMLGEGVQTGKDMFRPVGWPQVGGKNVVE